MGGFKILILRSRFHAIGEMPLRPECIPAWNAFHRNAFPHSGLVTFERIGLRFSTTGKSRFRASVVVPTVFPEITVFSSARFPHHFKWIQTFHGVSDSLFLFSESERNIIPMNVQNMYKQFQQVLLQGQNIFWILNWLFFRSCIMDRVMFFRRCCISRVEFRKCLKMFSQRKVVKKWMKFLKLACLRMPR